MYPCDDLAALAPAAHAEPCRCGGTLGEAAAALQREHETLPMLPLQAAKVMRNLLLHQYPEIDVRIVVDTVREDFPRLMARLRQLLAEDQIP